MSELTTECRAFSVLTTPCQITVKVGWFVGGRCESSRPQIIISNTENKLQSIYICNLVISLDPLPVFFCTRPPQWGAADAEIKVPSGENIERKRSPFEAWSRSVYSHTFYAYCQGFLPSLFLPFQSIHLHFFQNLSRFCLCWLWLTPGSCVGPQNKIGHPAGCRFPC